MTTTNDLRVYIASLSDYNAGILHGKWITVSDEDTMHEEIQSVLADSPTAKRTGLPAEEWAFHDFEGFHPYRPSEYEGIETLVKIAEQVEEHGEPYLHWIACESDNTDNDFTDYFLGEYDSLADYAAEQWEEWLAEQEPKCPDCWWHPSKFVDWQRMGEDLEMSGDIRTIEMGNKVLVFSTT